MQKPIVLNDSVSIILRLGGRQHRAVSSRFLRIVNVTSFDENEFIDSFTIELPREKNILEPETMEMERKSWLSGQRLIYLVFSPSVITEAREQKMLAYFTKFRLCTSLEENPAITIGTL